MKNNFFKKALAYVFCVSMLLGAVSCKKSNSSESSETIIEYDNYVERQLIGFETEEEIYSTLEAMKEAREFKLVTDEQYVTQGNAALKYVHDSEGADNYMPSSSDISPAIYIFNDEHGTGYGKDFSRVESLVVDIYNAQQYPVEVKLFVRTLINEVDRARYYTDTCILVPGANVCVFETDLERNVNMGLDNVQDLCLVFPEVQPHEETMTFYLDNLRVRELKEGASLENQTLPTPPTGGMITSFEEKVMYNTTYAGYYSNGGRTLTAFWNSNPDYVKEGKKSFGVISPCAGENWRDEQPYTTVYISKEYIRSFDFNQFTSQEAKIKIDVYLRALADDPRMMFRVYYEDGTSEKVVNANVTAKAGEWNTYEIPLYTEDGKNIGAQAITKICVQFWQKKGDGNYIYYLDNLRVEG